MMSFVDNVVHHSLWRGRKEGAAAKTQSKRKNGNDEEVNGEN